MERDILAVMTHMQNHLVAGIVQLVLIAHACHFCSTSSFRPTCRSKLPIYEW